MHDWIRLLLLLAWEVCTRRLGMFIHSEWNNFFVLHIVVLGGIVAKFASVHGSVVPGESKRLSHRTVQAPPKHSPV